MMDNRLGKEVSALLPSTDTRRLFEGVLSKESKAFVRLLVVTIFRYSWHGWGDTLSEQRIVFEIRCNSSCYLLRLKNSTYKSIYWNLFLWLRHDWVLREYQRSKAVLHITCIHHRRCLRRVQSILSVRGNKRYHLRCWLRSHHTRMCILQNNHASIQLLHPQFEYLTQMQ